MARFYGRQARDIARCVDDLPTLAWALLTNSVYDLGVGHWATVRNALGEALEIADHLGDVRRRAELSALLAQVMYCQGQFAPLADLAADMYAAACRTGDAQSKAHALLAHVWTLFPQGRFDEAVTALDEVITLLGDTVGRADEIFAYGFLALAHARRHELERARQAADRAARLIAQSRPMAVHPLEGYAAVAEVYLTLWEANDHQAARPAQQACAALRRLARVFPIAQPRAWLWQGSVEWRAGRPKCARQAWQKSLAAAERLAMPYQQGLAHYELGRHATGVDGPHHLERACAIFTQLDASYDMARARMG
jgi:tetratricopeptide (TPR) repeat protein